MSQISVHGLRLEDLAKDVKPGIAHAPVPPVLGSSGSITVHVRYRRASERSPPSRCEAASASTSCTTAN